MSYINKFSFPKGYYYIKLKILDNCIIIITIIIIIIVIIYLFIYLKK